MTEQEFAYRIQRALDESLERLPFRVTHRLSVARSKALALMPTAAQTVTQTAPATVGAAVFAVGGGGGASAVADGGAPSLLWRLLVTLLPFTVVIAGIFAISQWETWHRADDIADVDAAVLTDDVPISAYADRGFGVFLKNTDQ